MLEELVVCGQVLSGAIIVYGGLLSLVELMSVEHEDVPGSVAHRFTHAARFKVECGPDT